MVINTAGNLKDHIQEMWQKPNKILLKINTLEQRVRWEEKKLQ